MAEGVLYFFADLSRFVYLGLSVGAAERGDSAFLFV